MFYSSQNRVRPFLTTAASSAGAAATAIVFCLGASGDDFRLADHCFGYIAKAIFHFDQIADVQIGNHMDSGVGVAWRYAARAFSDFCAFSPSRMGLVLA